MESNENTTFEGWLKETLDSDQIRDLARYGATAGWPGLTYYSDTCALYAKFKRQIWEALLEDADEFGCKSIFDLIAGFSGAETVSCVATFENLLVWYMAERTAHRIDDSED